MPETSPRQRALACSQEEMPKMLPQQRASTGSQDGAQTFEAVKLEQPEAGPDPQKTFSIPSIHQKQLLSILQKLGRLYPYSVPTASLH
uniref:Uncharacterized protein n=1 Tax=Sphaerodactylus townsendi TaxID=933632 RepID=A0ACB8GCN5_9SAUR